MTESGIQTTEISGSAGQARALGLFLSEKYEDAASLYDELLAKDPDNMVFWENRMICRAEYLPESEDFIRQMKDRASDLSSQGNLCLAEALHKTGRDDEAREYIEKASEQDPDNIDAALMKADFLCETAQEDDLYDFIRSLYPRLKNDDRILCLAANYAAAFGNSRQVDWMLRRALKINRSYTIRNELFYRSLLNTGKVQKVMDYAVEAIEASNQAIIPWKMLSEAASINEEYEMADNAYSVLFEKDVLSESQLLSWANVRMNLGKYDEAFALMADLSQDSDEWMRQLFILFRTMQEAGQVKKCREKANLLLKKTSVTQNTRYICDLFLQNDREDAIPLPIVRMMNNVNAFAMKEALYHPSYRGPALLENLMQQLEVPIGRSLKILDLGCGVGNMSFMLEKYSRPSGVLDGTDIAIDALNYAVELDTYDTLNEKDMVSFCKDKENDKKYDLIVCINVFQYFSDLEQVIKAVRTALIPNGLFVFSVLPLSNSDKAFEFQPSGSFNHSSDYVSDCLKSTGLIELHQSKEVLFQFDQEEYPCYLFAAQKKK